uniref:Uncharacterized protein n=1 Tax=Oryza nivara TaxID=4536 RepID=A0A0E0IX81_ORYNI
MYTAPTDLALTPCQRGTRADPPADARELIRTVNDAGVALGTPPGSQQESSVLRNALQTLRQ